MKNIRLLVSTLCVAAFGVLGAAKAQSVAAPGNVKLMIETKTLTKEEANDIITNHKKVSLDLYLVLDANWKSQLEAQNVRLMTNAVSFAFFQDNTYTKDDFLQNPSDYINICRLASSLNPPGACTDIATEGGLGEWYGVYDPYRIGTANNETYPPTYAYGGLYTANGNINITYPYCTIKDGIYYIKLLEIQFLLENIGNRNSFPVGFLDEYNEKPTGGSQGNTELNIADKLQVSYRPVGVIASDWSRIPAPYFEFVNGGLFIENGPEVRTFEPSFLS